MRHTIKDKSNKQFANENVDESKGSAPAAITSKLQYISQSEPENKWELPTFANGLEPNENQNGDNQI